MKTITISSEHPDRAKPSQKIKVEIQGGSPYFGTVWVTYDEKIFCCCISPTSRGVSMKKW